MTDPTYDKLLTLIDQSLAHYPNVAERPTVAKEILDAIWPEIEKKPDINYWAEKIHEVGDDRGAIRTVLEAMLTYG